MFSKQISQITIFGDSLSDEGLMDHQRILDFIKFPGTGLEASGDGCFANGLSWPAFLLLLVYRQARAQLIQEGYTKERLAYIDKAFVSQLIDPDIETNDVLVNLSVGGFKLVDYAEGGATSDNYRSAEQCLKGLIAGGITTAGARAMVSNLGQQRRAFLRHRKSRECEDRSGNFIIEWTGANDLITVNPEPTYKAADRAVAARMRNVKKLYQCGYRHFALLNLPDLSKTPRYQKHRTQAQRDNASEVVQYFNRQLQQKVEEFSREQADCDIQVFDTDEQFNFICEHPEKFGLDPTKKHEELSSDPDYKAEPGVNPHAGKGYEYWNEVHPTSTIQRLIAADLLDKLGDRVAPLRQRLSDSMRVAVDNLKRKHDFVIELVQASKKNVRGALGGTQLDRELTKILGLPKGIKVTRNVARALNNPQLIKALKSFGVSYDDFKTELTASFEVTRYRRDTRWGLLFCGTLRTEQTGQLYQRLADSEPMEKVVGQYTASSFPLYHSLSAQPHGLGLYPLCAGSYAKFKSYQSDLAIDS